MAYGRPRIIVVGGMTYENYDPDRDPDGSIGHALAEEYFRRLGFNIDKLPKAAIWPDVTRIALKRFPELEKGEHISVGEIKYRLKMLRKAGYPVTSYSNMNAKELWDYFLSIKRDVAEKARDYCPNVLEEIIKFNEAQKREALEIR